MLNSYFWPLCEVRLPYAGRQKYMHEFDLSAPTVPEGFEDYLDPIRRLCAAAGATRGTAYATIDEKIVESGMSQRRPRPHVDGCFMARIMDWSHTPSPGWLHTCNDIGAGLIRRMPVIVAASVEGCRAWEGVFEAEPKSDGDLSHLELGEGVVLPANVGFWLSPDCVHESTIFNERVQRSFLRIALPIPELP